MSIPKVVRKSHSLANAMITLLTDFQSSEYTGAMKGVIYSVCPGTTVVDIGSIRKFDVRHGAYALLLATTTFPEGTIHCVVVDPGVGTKRRGVIIKTKKYTYVGPDNGVFSLVKDIEKVYEISYPVGIAVAKTFHGRDVFAPVAARIACGSKPEELGKKTHGITSIIQEAEVRGGTVCGEVFCIDLFGNIITNIRGEMLSFNYNDSVTLKINGEKHKIRFVESYGFAGVNELICLTGSAGYLEIAVNHGSASEMLNAKGGDKVEVAR